jgi:hypothetical protein
VDGDSGSDDPILELDSDIAALAVWSGSGISDASEETVFMPAIGGC